MRDTERGRDTGRGRSRFPMGSPMQNWIPGLWDHVVSQREMLNPEPPRCPWRWILNTLSWCKLPLPLCKSCRGSHCFSLSCDPSWHKKNTLPLGPVRMWCFYYPPNCG